MDRAQAMRERSDVLSEIAKKLHDPDAQRQYLSDIDEAVTAGADAAEARVLAWLRGDIQAAHDIGINLADAIERGEHWRGE